MYVDHNTVDPETVEGNPRLSSRILMRGLPSDYGKAYTIRSPTLLPHRVMGTVAGQAFRQIGESAYCIRCHQRDTPLSSKPRSFSVRHCHQGGAGTNGTTR